MVGNRRGGRGVRGVPKTTIYQKGRRDRKTENGTRQYTHQISQSGTNCANASQRCRSPVGVIGGTATGGPVTARGWAVVGCTVVGCTEAGVAVVGCGVGVGDGAVVGAGVSAEDAKICAKSR